MLREDRRGLEGLPLKLVITSLVIALSAPSLYGSLSYMDFTIRLGCAIDEAERIRQAALSAYVGGPGNVRTVSLSLGSAGFSACQIQLGGEEASTRASVIDILSRGSLVATVFLVDPSFEIVTENGAPLLLEGDGSVRLTCSEGGSGIVVLAEMV